MSETNNVKELQGEVMALVTAWADRGIPPSDSAIVLAGMGHSLLSKLGFTLGQVVSLIAEGWKRGNGKL
jgi:hypothetical protein